MIAAGIMSYLIMRRGPERGKIYHLQEDEVRIGRGSKNDIVIQDNDVSRDHLHLALTAEGYELRDLSNSNGTFINGQSVDGVWLLQSRCIIELGESITLEYRLGDPPDKLITDEVPSLDDLPEPALQHSFLVVITTSLNESTVYPLVGDSIVVGRATTNDIVIVEPEMSREHFRLTLTPQGYEIEDLRSTNGTFLNGEELNERRLVYNGDLIQIGTMVQMRITNRAERLVHAVETDTLIDQTDPTKDATRKRTTAQSEIPDIVRDSIVSPSVGESNGSLDDRILISYARQDWSRVVSRMVTRLAEAGIKVWVDQHLTEDSQDWQVATEQARLECWLLLVVVTQAAMESEQVKKNWRHFQNREKPIILLVAEPVEQMPIGANKLARVDYNPGVPGVSLRQLIGEITRTVRNTRPSS
jgi:pSer/pThr/pTyr-binding forkhead associated (FHA) protein